MKSSFFSELNVPGMVLNDFTAQHLAVDMRINFRGCNGLMTQHTLDGTEVGATFEQVRGEGMTEGMGTYVFMDTGGLRLLLDDMKYHDTGEGRSSPA